MFGPTTRSKNMSNPRSTAQVAGHPLHPMLVPFPIAFLVGTLVADIAFASTADVFWATAGFWLLVGAFTSLAVALAARNPSDAQAAIPAVLRIAWFVGLLIIIIGIALGWGRAGARLARVSLVLLLLYYGGMWITHKSAVELAEKSLPAEGVTRLVAWPMPANPLLWQSVATTESFAYRRYVNIQTDEPQWDDFRLIDPKFIEPLRRHIEARRFLDFARFASASVEERESGYRIEMQDLRFSLRMRAELDGDLNVISVDVGW
jgi:uncharacterized membrane protein